MSKSLTIDTVRNTVEKHLTKSETSARAFAAEVGTTQRVVLNLLQGRSTKDEGTAVAMYRAAGGRSKATSIAA